MKEVIKHDKSHRGNASQFFVAGELCRRGHSAVVTLGNCPNTDILCSNADGTKFVHIQVKTFRPNDITCSVGKKAERNYGENFFWVLSGIPLAGSNAEFKYYVVPSAIMAKNVAAMHSKWERTAGKGGRAHAQTDFRTVEFKESSPYYWDVSPFLNRWDLVDEKLC